MAQGRRDVSHRGSLSLRATSGSGVSSSNIVRHIRLCIAWLSKRFVNEGRISERVRVDVGAQRKHAAILTSKLRGDLSWVSSPASS